MQPCNNSSVAVLLYLDDELAGPERMALESHLNVCESCREMAAGEQRFRSELRAEAPLYPAPGPLRARVEEIVQKAAMHKAPAHLRARIGKLLG